MARKPYEGTQLWYAAQAVHEALDDATVLLQFGRAALDENRGRRRIVWVRPGGAVEPPERGAGWYRTPDEATADNATSPTGEQVDATNGTRVDFCFDAVDAAVVHLYAEDDALLERLFYNFLAALKIAAGNLVQPSTYVWPLELGDGALGARQQKLELRVACRFKAPEEVSSLTLITSETHTHTIDGGATETDVHD